MSGDDRARGAVGKVYLVGAGPGAADLLTVKAARLLGNADSVVFDHLVGAGVLDLIGPKAERLYVGKEPGRHELPQSDINRLLVERARAGLSVVRLKGGDPFVFGRGGEEILELAASAVPFEVVPGITAACAAAAYAGIPLTHRGLARACILVTGHPVDGNCELDWESLARPGQTIVVYMGVGAIGHICERLIEHGLAPGTPAAAVQNATLPSQATITSTLAALPALLEAKGLRPPAIFIIGDVVQLRSTLGWYTG
jgi:uroporphyrin-III C-methyltransferase